MARIARLCLAIRAIHLRIQTNIPFMTIETIDSGQKSL
jgi:hypothetical protein